ncbi:MAG: DnaD domain protein [Dehalococcoidales bacterium]|nr:DnaD domain protein [Dehalococcoidales bacterium]
MTQFDGFPTRMEFTPVPNLFINSLLAEITDVAELKLSLHVFRILFYKKGALRFVTYNELAGDVSLMTGIGERGKKPAETLRSALSAAVQRGTILHLPAEKNGAVEDIYFLNNKANREAVVKIKSGEIRLPDIVSKPVPEIVTEKQPNIFVLYEENIGLLTPMIAEELRDAERTYPETWIKDAVKEAVNAGKRNWRYISAILERWATEGRSDGTHLRDFKKADPDKFIKGKYGHIVKR